MHIKRYKIRKTDQNVQPGQVNPAKEGIRQAERTAS